MKASTQCSLGERARQTMEETIKNYSLSWRRILTMAELLRYLGGIHAILSLLCPNEQG